MKVCKLVSHYGLTNGSRQANSTRESCAV